jgi:hypothetical protein
VLALATIGTAAQARTSVGIGINLGGYAAPAPVYVAPQPAYVAPPAYAYGSAPVVVAPQPVYVAPPPPVYVAPPAVSFYYGPAYYRGWHHGYRHWR